jgi:DNA-binding transcriptional LysR family regulator
MEASMRYSLRQLEVFLATARYENVTRAAEALAMSQSAASGSLRELENQFGVKLFDHLLAQAQALELALAGRAAIGRLQVGATLTIGNYIAVNMIADFRRRFPQAEIALHVANTEAIAERVASFELDMGLIEGELQHANLDIAPWRDDELVVFAAPGHPLAKVAALSDADLVALPWIVRERGSGTRQAFDRAMRGILSELHIAMELQHTEAIKRAVEAGLGVGCLSRVCLTDAFKRGSLVPLPVPGRDFHREWYLIMHREKFHSTALLAWLRLCREDWAA